MARKKSARPETRSRKAATARPARAPVRHKSLTLSGCPFAEAELLAMIEPCVALERLVLEYCEIGDAGLARLGGLDRLRELNLADTRVTGDGLASLARMVRLRSLDLQGLPIRDAHLGHLRSLSDLRSLNLSRTAITDAGLALLSDKTCLEHLYFLECPGLTAQGLSHLEGLAQMKSLSLDQTLATAEGLARIRQLPSLKRLYLLGSRGRCIDPADLRAALPGAHVNDVLHPLSLAAEWE